jgi:uncharacterized protein (TIGR03067 family)
MRKYALLVVTASLSLAFAPAPLPKPDVAKEDLRKMQGSWALTSCLEAGRPLPSSSEGIVVVIAGDRMTYSYRGGSHTEWAMALDARRKPKVLDTRLSTQPGAAAWPGVYELKGDTLWICYVAAPGARPGGLSPSKQGEVLHVLTRQKR